MSCSEEVQILKIYAVSKYLKSSEFQIARFKINSKNVAQL